MYIVVTDCGHFWNHENPILKKYKESVIVVCLNGKKVTDEYRCFVSPYKMEEHSLFVGQEIYGTSSEKYRALESVSDKLVGTFGYHEKVLFLTDNNSESLYPFLLCIGKNKYMSTHLCAISPLLYNWEGNIDYVTYVMNEHPSLKSLFYIDMAEFFNKDVEYESYDIIEARMNDYFAENFPRILNGIHKLRERSYFDFASMSYVPLTDGFEKIDVSNKEKTVDEIDFDITPQVWMLGRVALHEYPSKEPYIIRNTEQLTARIDGKKICNILREQRIRLAQENNIPFESEECPSIGPCAGTCKKCDSEAAYLREQLEKIPYEERIYPQFDVLEEMKYDR